MLREAAKLRENSGFEISDTTNTKTKDCEIRALSLSKLVMKRKHIGSQVQSFNFDHRP